MVHALPFTQLHQGEIIRYLSQFIRVLRAGSPLSDALSSVLDDLQEKLSEMETGYRISNAASQSARLLTLEAERDRYVAGLGKLCDGFRKDPSSTHQAAAQSLHANLKLYGGPGDIVRQTVKTETTSINSILRDWRQQPELAAAVTTLGLERWVTALGNCNSEYETLTVGRGQERGAADVQIDYTVKDKIDEARPLYEEALTLLAAGSASARRTGGNNASWLSAISAVNAISEEYAALRASRETQAEKKVAEAPGV